VNTVDVQKAVTIAQIVVGIALVSSILLQNRGEGLGSFFGGGGEVFRTRRGLENILYFGTIVLAVLLVVLSIVNTTIS
jgi:protein translocase SecG subunit